MMNLPNLLTLCRLPLGLAVFLIVSRGSATDQLIAGCLFCLAGLLDRLDGWLARRLNQITAFGQLWDPVADKVLIHGALLAGAIQGLWPGWFAYLCLARDLVITAARDASTLPADRLAANRWGKWKTRLQFAFIVWTLLSPAFAPEQSELRLLVFWALMLLAASATVASGILYLKLYSVGDSSRPSRIL